LTGLRKRCRQERSRHSWVRLWWDCDAICFLQRFVGRTAFAPSQRRRRSHMHLCGARSRERARRW